jgi:hypothetical protein
MANSTGAAAITLNFCHVHWNYPGAEELAEAVRKQYFTDEVFRPFPGVHPEILGLFSGYRTRNGRPILQFYVNGLIPDGLVGIYLLGISQNNHLGLNSRHDEVRVLAFKSNGTRIILPREFRTKLTNFGNELHEAQITSKTEEEFWVNSDEMGVPMFNLNQGRIVLMDRHDAPHLTVQDLDELVPWYNVITRQPLDPSKTRAEPFDWFESDQYYHTYFVSTQDFSRMSPKEVAVALWEGGTVVTPPVNTGSSREGLGFILGPFNVEDIWNASSLKPLINDLDIPKIH